MLFAGRGALTERRAASQAVCSRSTIAVLGAARGKGGTLASGITILSRDELEEGRGEDEEGEQGA